jgi:tRNA threonylcarbamoyladenosine biosynthesis protein TsaE
MDQFVFSAANETDTARLGAALAEILPDGAVVALCGTLGAGKTRLVQTVAYCLDIDPRQVVSPTFMLIQEYHGQKSVYHIDAYRLASEREFLALGAEEYFETGGLVFIEWADRVANCLPRDTVSIDIEVIGESGRRFNISTTGEKYASLIADLAGKLGESV